MGIFDDKKILGAVVYFGELKALDGAILHSGDDRTGDMDGDDGLDNEIITIKMNSLQATVDKVPATSLNLF